MPYYHEDNEPTHHDEDKKGNDTFWTVLSIIMLALSAANFILWKYGYIGPGK